MSEVKGRPSRIFETERVKEFLQLIQDGVDFNIAADSSQLARSTVFDWLKQGRDIQNQMEDSIDLTIKDQAILDFLEGYKRARAASEVRAVETISKSIENGSWRAAAWILEHRFPERWAIERIEKKGENLLKPEAPVLISELEGKVEAILKMRKNSNIE